LDRRIIGNWLCGRNKNSENKKGEKTTLRNWRTRKLEMHYRYGAKERRAEKWARGKGREIINGGGCKKSPDKGKETRWVTEVDTGKTAGNWKNEFKYTRDQTQKPKNGPLNTRGMKKLKSPRKRKKTQSGEGKSAL